jgi:hypothetical protein
MESFLSGQKVEHENISPSVIPHSTNTRVHVSNSQYPETDLSSTIQHNIIISERVRVSDYRRPKDQCKDMGRFGG